MAVDVVVIGTSLGGLHALRHLLGRLPDKLPLPIAVAHHFQPGLGAARSRMLKQATTVPVEEAEDKQAIEPGRVYLAPPDYHLLIDRGSFALSMEPPVNGSRPSIDVLFETAARAYGPGAVAIVLTGANRDGTEGARWIKSCGGVVIAQDPATAERATMPAAIIGAGLADAVWSLDEIAAFLCRPGTRPRRMD